MDANPQIPHDTPVQKWAAEIRDLRAFLQNFPLEETVKWNKPCFTYQGKNVVLIQPFKDYCALLFFKGMLLEDPTQLLQKTGAQTRVGRQYRLQTSAQLQIDQPPLQALITAAIQLEKEGQTIPKKAPETLVFPPEISAAFQSDAAFAAAFTALTPGRQKAYCFYIQQAKQAKTKLDRIKRIRPAVLAGKGLHDPK